MTEQQKSSSYYFVPQNQHIWFLLVLINNIKSETDGKQIHTFHSKNVKHNCLRDLPCYASVSHELIQLQVNDKHTYDRMRDLGAIWYKSHSFHISHDELISSKSQSRDIRDREGDILECLFRIRCIAPDILYVSLSFLFLFPTPSGNRRSVDRCLSYSCKFYGH